MKKNYILRSSLWMLVWTGLGLSGPAMAGPVKTKVIATATAESTAPLQLIWQIGQADGSADGMALAPGNYKDYLPADFGWEDKSFVIGHSNAKNDWPYVLPGPADGFGGTGGTSGIRSSFLNILFSIDRLQGNQINQNSVFTVQLVGYQAEKPALLKVTVNGHPFETQLKKGKLISVIDGNKSDYKKAASAGQNYTLTIPTTGLLKQGGNEIQLTSLDGSWVVFDQLKLEAATKITLSKPAPVFIRSVKPADYELSLPNSKEQFQPLLVDLQELSGQPDLTVKLDGREIFTKIIDTGRFVLEVPMPAVSRKTNSTYEILCNGHKLAQGKITRSSQPLKSVAQYVDTRLGTAHSRWMIAPGPWMPFSMVKVGPDNQDAGWMGGYEPIYESVGTFSHIHEWTLAGLGTFPTSGPLKLKVGRRTHPEEGYRSKMDKQSEISAIDYYKVKLTDYNILAELTATTRASFQRYTYPKGELARVMIDLKIPAEYRYSLKDVTLKKVSDYRIEGSSRQFTPNAWSGDVDQDYTVHFVIEFDRPIKSFGTWVGDSVVKGDLVHRIDPSSAGAFVEFDTKASPVIQMRTGISLVSVANAAENLKTEISDPFGWHFNQVRAHSLTVWNGLMNRLKIKTDDAREKMRFYTNVYRALSSRNTWSDVNGEWVDASKKVQQLTDPTAVALGCDAFWNTFWNLNQFWNLAYPEWSSKWVKSQLAMYDAGGWLAKGPAGMNYIPVMVAEHEIPLIVGAYQMGIRDYDAHKALEAVVKMQTTPAQHVGEAGYAGNRDLLPYLKYHYVPDDKGRFSNTLEYSYDDWTVAQLAKALGDEKTYLTFKERGSWWKNAIDSATGYARMRHADGNWMEPFDPFRSGANKEYVEGNAWQLTYYVPQDIPGLIKRIGADRFVDRLVWGFTESEKLRFNAPGDQYWDYPVIQGNEQSMHFAYLFNWAKKPWLTQQWSRSILDRYYGYGTANAYLGDEDQGQMSGWFVMTALGLFQTDGGAAVNPNYEITSPLYPEVTIDLGGQYGRGKTFKIIAHDVSRTNKYIQSAKLNGQQLNRFYIPTAALLKGGELVLQMGPAPNKHWGIESVPVAK